MVAVCNNLSFSKVFENSDIDLFIVARKGHLFTVRIFVTVLLGLFGVRRHEDKVKGRFCLSFFVDDSFLDLSKIAIRNDIYLAFWIRSLKPVIDDGVSDEFLKANIWAKSYFEDGEGFEIDRGRVIKDFWIFKFFRSIFSLIFGNWFETVMRNWQIKRAQKKALNCADNSNLIVGDSILKFHNIDRRELYREKWIKKFGAEKLTDERFLSL